MKTTLSRLAVTATTFLVMSSSVFASSGVQFNLIYMPSAASNFPNAYWYELQPGGSITDPIGIHNNLLDPISVESDYSPVAVPYWGAAPMPEAWFSMDSDLLGVNPGPGAQAQFNFTVNVPGDAAPGLYAMAMVFDGRDYDVLNQQAGVYFGTALGKDVYIEVVEPEEQPVEPEEQPVEPEEQPVEPEEQPVEPEEQPVEPEEQPVEPAQPAEPEDQPTLPDEEPAELNLTLIDVKTITWIRNPQPVDLSKYLQETHKLDSPLNLPDEEEPKEDTSSSTVLRTSLTTDPTKTEKVESDKTSKKTNTFRSSSLFTPIKLR